MFNLNISNLDNTFKCVLNALEQTVLCGYLPKLRQGSILDELNKKGISLTDCVDDQTDIGLLIGSDILGTLLTGWLERVDDSLLAMETKFGWTLQGPAIGVYCSGDGINALHASCDYGNIEDFWRLETLGSMLKVKVKKRLNRK